MEPRERLAVLVRRWPVVLAGLLAGLALALAVIAVTPPTYRAGAVLFVSRGLDVPTPTGTPASTENLTVVRMRSYPSFASGPDVLGPVARQLGLAGAPQDIARRIVVAVPSGTQLIEVRALDATASGAAALANAVGDRLARVIVDVEAPDDVRVRTIVPAVPPPAPTWPSVPVLLASGLLAGLLTGAGATLLVERLRTRSA